MLNIIINGFVFELLDEVALFYKTERAFLFFCYTVGQKVFSRPTIAQVRDETRLDETNFGFI